MAEQLFDDWVWAWETHQVRAGYAPTPEQMGARALANLALRMLCLAAVRRGDAVWPGKAYQRFKDAGNMTDRLGAIAALVESHSPLADKALDRLHALAAGDALMLDQWFALQATAPEPLGERCGSAFDRARSLLQHPDFSIRNPNRARSLLFALATVNAAAFHRADGAGYKLWADKLIELDAINGHVAGRFARAMDRWARLAEPYRGAAHAAIARVAARPDLSNDVREIVGRALQSATA